MSSLKSITQPNVVLIVCDDLAWGDLACHGNEHVHTPALDQLHASSLHLTRYCSGPLCTPARASLMTGRYHLRTRAFDTYLGRSMIDPDEKTIAHVLGQRGYATGLFGKWHLGDNAPSRPNDMGFEEALYHLGGGLRQPGNLGRNSYFNPDLIHNGKLVQSHGYCTDIFTNAAINFVQKNSAEPFFLLLSTNAPHTPLEVAEDLIEPYRNRGLPEPFARIYAMVQNIDTNVGRVLRKLDEMNLTENTIVIFTSDHGPCAGANDGRTRRFNAGLRDGKGTLYEGGIRVPCLWRWPGYFKAGQEIDGVTGPMDVLPTLAAVTGAGLPEDRAIDGVNLLPALTSKSASDNMLGKRQLFMQWHRGDQYEKFRNAGCIEKKYKWYRPHLGDDELYDIETDPFEKHNVADEFSDKVAEMRQAYALWFEDVTNTRPDNFAPVPILFSCKEDAPPVYLTWQDWRIYGSEEKWGADNPGWWQVYLPHEGRFDIEIETWAHDQLRTLNVRCGTVNLKCPTHKELRGYLFKNVLLPAGKHKFEAYLSSPQGKRVGVVSCQVQSQSKNRNDKI